MCFHPLPAWRAPRDERGVRPLVFSPDSAWRQDYDQVELPCGRCIDCLKSRSSEWALRCEHEARLHAQNWFITLTYSDENLPLDGSLSVDHLQRFWKRLRKANGKLRYFACGEYGEETSRPHYHALVFGWAPPGARQLLRARPGDPWRCEHLDEVWGLGRTHLLPFSAGAAYYVAGYAEKKLLGTQLAGRKPEFQLMSRRPGIGTGYLERYYRDIYPRGVVTRRGGSLARTPRLYDLKMKVAHPRLLKAAQLARRQHVTPTEASRNHVQEDHASLMVKHWKTIKRNKI